MFTLAGRYAVRRRGLRSRVTRLYDFKWFGEPSGARFDAGLVSADGLPRAAFGVFRRFAPAHR